MCSCRASGDDNACTLKLGISCHVNHNSVACYLTMFLAARNKHICCIEHMIYLCIIPGIGGGKDIWDCAASMSAVLHSSARAYWLNAHDRGNLCQQPESKWNNCLILGNCTIYMAEQTSFNVFAETEASQHPVYIAGCLLSQYLECMAVPNCCNWGWMRLVICWAALSSAWWASLAQVPDAVFPVQEMPYVNTGDRPCRQ